MMNRVTRAFAVPLVAAAVLGGGGLASAPEPAKTVLAVPQVRVSARWPSCSRAGIMAM